MKIKTLNNSDKVPFNLDAFIMHNEQKLELVYLTLKPNEKLEVHKNPFDVIFYVISGKGELIIEDEKNILEKNNCIKVASKFNRGWTNNTNTSLELLVIKLLG